MDAKLLTKLRSMRASSSEKDGDRESPTAASGAVVKAEAVDARYVQPRSAEATDIPQPIGKPLIVHLDSSQIEVERL